MKLWALVLLSLLAGLQPAQAASDVYRHFVWGVSPQDVREFETALYYKTEGGSQYYLLDDPGNRAMIRYDFDGGKLWRIQFGYERLSRPDPQLILNMMTEEEQKLTRRFGKPVKEEMVWKDRTYRNYPKFYGRAFGMSDLTFRTMWEQGNTQVTLEAFRDDLYYQLGYVLQDKRVIAKQDAAKTFNFNLRPQ